MREFGVIDAAVSEERLRMRLKENELEQYGEAFIPDFVYDVIRRLPRFSSMRVSLHPSLSDACWQALILMLFRYSVAINRMLKNFLASFSKGCTTNVCKL
jgi:hypothetical protein